MAYDTASQSLVLFGGQVAAGRLGDTWRWDGAAWQQLTPAASPSPRHGHQLAYDAARQRTVLFGGTDAGGLQGDTWSWTGTTWQLLSPAASPSARSGHAMAYDSARQRIVLFGGTTNAGVASDTWEWNGTDWLLMATAWAPPARAGHVVAYDELRQRIVLFGGSNGTRLADTWEWNGSFWTPAFTSTYPSARTGAAIACDAARQRLVLFGGSTGAAVLADTWEFNGINWSVANPVVSPPARDGHAMAYDAARARLVLFGGNGVGGLAPADTWSSTTGATATAYGTGCGVPPLVMTPDASSPPVLGQVGRTTITNTPSSVGAMALGLSNQMFGPFLLPVTLAGVGMPGCDLLQSAELLGGPVSPTSPATAAFALALPTDASLLDLHIYLQAYFFAPGANALQVVVSNGVDWRLGDPALAITLTEPFVDSSNQDLAVSSSIWNAGARPGLIGNDGRHGSFDVTMGVALGGGAYEWNTDSFLIPGSRSFTGQDFTITDGRFYFTDFVLPAGTTLRFAGTVAPQIWVRGRADVQGTIDIRAAAMPFWIPTTGPAAGQRVQDFNGLGPSYTYSATVPNFADGQPGGAGGIGGGRGGKGGDECRLDGDVTVQIGLETVHVYYGRNGDAVRVPAGHAYAAAAVGTGGRGSLLHPISGTAGLTSPVVLLGFLYRGYFTPGGGGGGFSGPGGQATFLPMTSSTPTYTPSFAAAQPGGGAFALLPLPASLPGGFTSLNHFVVGGSGGGGGGSHAYATQNNASIGYYVAGSGGSGGGGAMALRVGGDLTIGAAASLLANGGEGVLITGDNPGTPLPDAFWGVSSPGGGGSGGSFLLQAGQSLACGGAIDVRGGAGSRTGSVSILSTGSPAAFNEVSQAGAGAPGFYRLEAGLAAPAFTGTGQPAYDPGSNAGPLTDRDALTGSASKWRASGRIVPPTWLRYELDVDTDADGLVDTTYTDSGLPGTLKANDPSGPVTILFQGAVLDLTGTMPLPGPLPPWREGIGSGGGVGIDSDAVTGVRFQLLFNRSLFPDAVVRSLRIFAQV
jgi:hypothetical protein